MISLISFIKTFTRKLNSNARMRRDQAKLQKTLARMEGAYAASTIRAYRADVQDLIKFCIPLKRSGLPATPPTVAEFVEHLSNSGRGSASIRRAIASISSLHTLNGVADPTKSIDVKLAMRRMHRKLGRHSRQAYGITRTTLKQLIAATSQDLRGARDRALLLVAYDALCRRSELLLLRVEDFRRIGANRTKSGALFLQTSKTDQERQGRWLRVSPRAASALERWIKQSRLNEGALFRGITRGGNLTSGLDPGQVNRIYKRLAEKAALSQWQIRAISGHSLRVGAAQDLVASGASIPLIMQQGRWSKSDTVMRYVEMIDAPL